VDGYDLVLKEQTMEKMDDRWRDLMEGRDEWNALSDTASVRKPDRSKVRDFAWSILDECLRYRPRWLTVPQLPVTSDTSRNRVNRMLAEATCRWKEDSGFKGELVLPLVFTHGDQLKRKGEWGPKVTLARKCLEDAGASIVWTVDSNLSDQLGWSTLDQRFSALVKFHEGLRRTFSEERIIAGPYWVMTLVLWVRKLCDHPAISLGSGYRYYVAGGHIRTPKVRIVIPPIRRWVVATPSLKDWLRSALRRFSRSDPVYKELKKLEESFDALIAAKANGPETVEQFEVDLPSVDNACEPRFHVVGNGDGGWDVVEKEWVIHHSIVCRVTSTTGEEKAKRIADLLNKEGG